MARTPAPTSDNRAPTTDGTVPIEDYAALGDGGTVALVSVHGSVDWLCLPRFDSPSCFAALLGRPDHGRWLLGPAGPARSTQEYVGDTFVLRTTHTTETGSVAVTDVMPVGDGRADVVRIVEGLTGTVGMRHEWIVRFGYGQIVPWVSRMADPHSDGEIISAVAGPDMLVLRGHRLPHADDGRHVDTFDVSAGDRLEFSCTWFPSYEPVPPPVPPTSHLASTLDDWQEWSARTTYTGVFGPAVRRSLMTLRLLTSGATGGIVAAPTTSLPEDFGGERNWDYRFCWLRDASLTVQALLQAGFTQEIRPWRQWLIRAIAGDPQDMQIMYTVDGGRYLPERTLDHLPGYAGSAPVRVGNGAVGQKQTDVLGEVLLALRLARECGVHETSQSWAVQRALVDELAQRWKEPDNGLWEIRGPRRHFTHSRIMVWAAFDCAVAAVENHGLPGPVDRWRRIRDEVHAEVLQHGFDRERNTFTQHYETRAVDASLLLAGMVGFLPPDDPRVLGTISAVQEDLMRDGLLLRYRTETGVDGLSGDEHPFLACSFWLVEALARAGSVDDADRLMRRLVGLTNAVGLLSEEYDPVRGRMVGNYPQAFSHLTLISAAVALEAARSGARHQDS